MIFFIFLISVNVYTQVLSIRKVPLTRARIRLGEANVVAEVARTKAQQVRGLSGRTSLGQDEGMWFSYSNSEASAFWMRGMLIPIDIIWVREKKVISISDRVPPPLPNTALKDLPIYTSSTSADGVLEVNAGWAKAHNVGLGTLVVVQSIF